MQFIQIIECHTTRDAEVMALEDEWEKATEGRRTLRRSIVTTDRQDPARHLIFAFFDDYDSAMVNSALPETDEFGQKQMALLDGPMTFTDLDVVEERSYPSADADAGASVAARSFAKPDETRRPDKTLVEVVDLGTAKAARMTLEPGWTWSACIKPLVGTTTCQARHVGTATGGRLHVVHDDGTELDISAGDAYVIEPGHDARVVGDESFVAYEFEPTTVARFAAAGAAGSAQP